MNHYQISAERTGGYRVFYFVGGRMRIAFYGTQTECQEWIERNGHDTDA